MDMLPTFRACGHFPSGRGVAGLHGRRTSWYHPSTHKCAISFVHFSRHVSSPNEVSKTFVTDWLTVSDIGSRHTHGQHFLRGVMVTGDQYRLTTLEVAFDVTILVGSLTHRPVWSQHTKTANSLSECSRGWCLPGQQNSLFYPVSCFTVLTGQE